jgi:hypothetical protein|tara:strand:- start:1650 stop:2141 length:492 start_codon:yes stop_codon:yes gene_type:complete
MRKTLQTKCKASVGYSQGIIKGASLNPAAHLYILEYTDWVGVALTQSMHPKKRVITFIFSENGNMINLVVACTALPGGYRNNNGNYNNMGNNSYFWSSTENNSNNAWNRNLNYNNSDANRNNNNKKNGFSVRCVRDLKLFENRSCFSRSFAEEILALKVAIVA